MLISDIHHVSLNVVDLDRAVEFYTAVLGFDTIARPDMGVDGVWLRASGDRQVHLIVAAVPADTGQHVAFQVADLDDAVRTLRAQSVAISDPRAIGDTRGRQAFLHDPDGNRLELTQPA